MSWRCCSHTYILSGFFSLRSLLQWYSWIENDDEKGEGVSVKCSPKLSIHPKACPCNVTWALGAGLFSPHRTESIICMAKAG